MKGDRIETVRQYVSSIVPNSSMVILYTMSKRTIKMTELLPVKEFIQRNKESKSKNQSSDGKDNIISLYTDQVYESSEKKLFRSYDSYDAPLIESNTFVKYKIDTLTENGILNYSNDYIFSLYNFECRGDTDIIKGLKGIFNELHDMVSNELKNKQENKNVSNIYFLFCTDADDKIETNSIKYLQKCMKILQKNAINAGIELFNEIYIIDENLSLKNKDYISESVQLLKSLFDNTNHVPSDVKQLNKIFKTSSKNNCNEVQKFNRLKTLQKEMNEKTNVLTSIDISNEKIRDDINNIHNVKIDQISTNNESLNKDLNTIEANIEQIQLDINDFNNDENRRAINEQNEEKIENLCLECAQIKDNALAVKKEIVNEEKQLSKDNETIEKNIKVCTKIENDINEIEKQMSQEEEKQNDDESQVGKLSGIRYKWLQNIVRSLWKRVMKVLKSGSQTATEAVSLGKEMRGLFRKLDKEGENIKVIETRLCEKINQLDEMLDKLENVKYTDVE